MVNTAIEEYFVIDADARFIEVPESMKNIGVANDNKAETITLKIPRYFENTDLLTLDCYVNFLNAKNEYGVQKVTTEALTGGGFILIHWTIDNRFTKYQGVAKFNVLLTNTTTEYQWSTQPCELNILPCLDSGIDDSVNTISITKAKDILDTVSALDSTVSTIGNSFADLQELVNDTLSARLTAVENSIETIKERLDALENS